MNNLQTLISLGSLELIVTDVFHKDHIILINHPLLLLLNHIQTINLILIEIHIKRIMIMIFIQMKITFNQIIITKMEYRQRVHLKMMLNKDYVILIRLRKNYLNHLIT
jgi:hypothetical protein